MTEILFKALLSGIFIACLTSMIGCFIVWRRMAYFGDSLAHSALLGIAIGLLFGFNVHFGIIAIAIIFALILSYLEHKSLLTSDTILGILAHSSLAIGLLIVSFTGIGEIDLHDFLLGDILDISWINILYIFSALLVTTMIMLKFWHKFILISLNKDLAHIQGVKVFRLQFLFLLLVAITVASTIQIIGVLLISSMLIIPAATSRIISRTPIAMCIVTIACSILAVIVGTVLSYNYNAPSGPAIIIAAIFIMLLINIINRIVSTTD
ncbi:MAG: metal ABC transporter permease [Rickettsiales bacterium]|nr:metal ABC transporter permease [Rickettsiales bacterium]